MVAKQKILWIDDEIDSFKAQIIFLQKNNFDVLTATNAHDALDIIKDELVDLILLDEIMPGLRGLEALMEIKKIRPHIPVVMVTKSEEEDVMNEAIGKNISGYLIKPVSNAQLLSTVKQHVQKPKLFEEQTRKSYFESFRELTQKIDYANEPGEWIEIYKEITYWDLQTQSADSKEMEQFIEEQKDNANVAFSNFIEKNYLDWIKDEESRPLMSQVILKEKLFPQLKNNDEPVALILIDNFRYDHWLTVSSLVSKYFKIEQESLFYSILPTTTQYSRNAIFSGLMPAEIKRLFPDYWFDDEEDEHKNMFEKELLEKNLTRHGIKTGFFFRKIFNNSFAEKVNKEINEIKNNKLSVIIYNFIDILSHRQTSDSTLKELASDEKSYRSITHSWFSTSPINTMLKQLAENKIKVFITTDHGSIRIKKPIKIVGYKETSTNIRYKQGKALTLENSKDERNIFLIDKPQNAILPQPHPSSKYIFAKNDYFLVYPNNYNDYVKKFRNSFQHGGISMEEMLIPFISLIPREL